MTVVALPVVEAVVAAAGAALLIAPRARPPSTAMTSARVHADERALLVRLRPVLVLFALLGGWTVVGGAVGLLAGAVAAVVAWRVLGRAESPAARRRREELERDLPTAVHLLGACLDAGAAVVSALEEVARALPGAVAEELLLAHDRLAVGVDPAVVWGRLADQEELRPLGRALARAHETGASVRDVVAALAAELAARSRARTDELARSVEVRAAAPLGVCFLPAFLLLGVVPMVVGVFSTMRPFG
jgi:Flp pilus assembly protein TadB